MESNDARQAQITTLKTDAGRHAEALQEDRKRKAECSDNKGVYRSISNSSMSLYLPASSSCVDTLEPRCLTELACWMLQEH